MTATGHVALALSAGWSPQTQQPAPVVVVAEMTQTKKKMIPTTTTKLSALAEEDTEDKEERKRSMEAAARDAVTALERQGRLVRLKFAQTALGLSLVLSRLQGDAESRRRVVVEETFADKGGGVAYRALRPRDELVAVENQLVVDLDVDGFAALLRKLKNAPRPLTLVFAKQPAPLPSWFGGGKTRRRRRCRRGSEKTVTASKTDESTRTLGKSSFAYVLLCCVHVLLLAGADCLRRVCCFFSFSESRWFSDQDHENKKPKNVPASSDLQKPLLPRRPSSFSASRCDKPSSFGNLLFADAPSKESFLFQPPKKHHRRTRSDSLSSARSFDSLVDNGLPVVESPHDLV